MDCFVIMPFGDPKRDKPKFDQMESIYSDWIKPTVEAVLSPNAPNTSLQCHRAGKQQGPGDIVEHVIDCLIDARVVIADLIGRNANVFYELGVRHAISDSTILIAENMDDIPFDVRTLRAILYEYTPPGMLRFQKDLRAAIASILAQPNRIDNPVRRILQRREHSRVLSASAAPNFGVVQSLTSELAALRTEFQVQRAELVGLINEITAKAVRLPDARSSDSLHHLQGVWRGEPEESLYCIKIVKGELRVAYSYGQTRELTSQFFNCQLAGDILVCRFQWFDSPETKGVVALRIGE